MELILRIPKGKPPFLGILFNYENDASSLNKELISDPRSIVWKLILEPSQKLYITLSYQNERSSRYEVDYDPVSLLKFLHNTKDCKEFSFGHLLIKNEKYSIAKTREWNKQLLFKVGSIVVPLLVIEK